ncbi:MAG: urea ABC transporter permease subunit UrtC [Pseudomonadota bacterium]
MISRAITARGWVFLGLLLLAAVAVPACNLAVQPGGAMHVPSFVVGLLGKYLCYALLALSVDLVWGYVGILSLGHGAFFALGGYAMGMHLMREIGTRGVYADPILPDFMVFLNWQELPWFWWGFDMFWFACLMVLLVPGALAFVFGWFAFRSRVTGVYLSIITQAMTYALMLAFFRNDMGFGGNNGLTDFKDVLGFDLQTDETRAGLFALSCLALGAGYVIARIITTSRAGKVLVSIRDAEGRARFLGYRVEGYKLAVFTISAMMAGVAGALYVPQVGIINPGEFSPANSIEAVIWVAVGGRGTLIGPVIGALSVNGFETFFTSFAPDQWLFALGGLFVAVVLFLPRGILGEIDGFFARRRARRGGKAAQPEGVPASLPQAGE